MRRAFAHDVGGLDEPQVDAQHAAAALLPLLPAMPILWGLWRSGREELLQPVAFDLLDRHSSRLRTTTALSEELTVASRVCSNAE